MRKKGRPAVYPRRRHEIHVRVNAPELRRIKQNAEAHGLKLSDFFRQRVLTRSERVTNGQVVPHVSPRRQEAEVSR
jgi:predicted DNA binding CopG/RHH family protein